jgi:hypothetical protein
MSEIAVKARKVRFNQNVPDGKGGFGFEWSDQHVRDLVVFPARCMARCRIGEKVLIAFPGGWAQVDPESQAIWEGGGPCTCTTCGAQFANEQGLGSHMRMKHEAQESPPNLAPGIGSITADNPAKRSRGR